MRRRLLLAPILALSLVAAACDPGAINDFLSELLTSDFSLSSDTGVQAAGATSGVNDAEAVARKAREDAVAARDSSLVDLESRPKDPRNMMTKGMLELNERNLDALATFERAKGLVEEANPNDPSTVQDRKARELYLDTLLDLIKSDGDLASRDRLSALYCWQLSSYVVSQDQNDPAVQLYLLFADGSLCG